MLGRKNRDIHLNSIHNMRTLAGMVNVSGKKIADHKLIRSAALDKLTEKDARILREKYQIKKVIDLRTGAEREKHPDLNMDGIVYLHMPVFADAIPGISREVEPGRADNLKAGMLPDLRNMYRDLVSDPECIENFRIILQEIIRHRDGSILWHCTAGKDRCGMISAMVEAMLGIDRKAIMEDYKLTNKDTKKTAGKYYWLIRIFKRDKETARMIYDAYIASPEYLQAAFDAIDDQYGGFRNYIVDVLKIDPREIQDFRQYILND